MSKPIHEPKFVVSRHGPCLLTGGGASANQPFCDGSRYKIGLRDREQATAQ